MTAFRRMFLGKPSTVPQPDLRDFAANVAAFDRMGVTR